MQESNTDVMRFTHFSQHAHKRVLQRTHLSLQRLALVLDQKLVVNTGTEPGLQREHLLFYSIPDADCFIAVRDSMTGKVVTVLPLEYHENLAWKVSLSQVQMAKELACGVNSRPKSATANPSAPTGPSMLVVSCSYVDACGNYRVMVLVKVKASLYDSDINTFMRNPETSDLIDAAAQSKNLNPERMLILSVRLGNNGTPTTWVINEGLLRP
jgi:hypothetical protein